MMQHCLRLLVLLTLTANAATITADIFHDFSSNPITWNTTSGPLMFDADGDLIHDLQISVTTGFIDPGSGRYVIDNDSTSSGNIEKTFLFAISSIDPQFDQCTFNLLGFDFYSEKNTEPGGKGGAGSISVDVFDDMNMELVNSINISGSLGSSPTNVVLPPNVATEYFVLAVDLDSPPNNADAQVILGDFIFNGGTVLCSSSAVPEPSSLLALMAASSFLWLSRRCRN
ncbi:MAG: PEP-CTERM sorting domain-containing protein [Pirellulaceae bacterium]